jgi:hypothetical protein
MSSTTETVEATWAQVAARRGESPTSGGNEAQQSWVPDLYGAVAPTKDRLEGASETESLRWSALARSARRRWMDENPF